MDHDDDGGDDEAAQMGKCCCCAHAPVGFVFRPSLPPPSSLANRAKRLTLFPFPSPNRLDSTAVILKLSAVEVLKLQRKQRATDNQRTYIKNQSNDEIRRQEASIRLLTRDNARVKDELDLIEREIADREATGSTLKDLQIRFDGYQEEIKAEEGRVAEMEAQLVVTRKELKTAQEALGKAEKEIKGVEKFNHWIQTYENRVQQALNAYNLRLASNAKLRQTVEHLKSERIVFAGMKNKVQVALERQTAAMQAQVEMANAAYESRAEAQAKMQAVRDKATKEGTLSVSELKELNRILEHEKRLKTFMGTKAADKSKQLQAAEQARHDKEKGELPEAVTARYEAAFAEMQTAAGVNDINELVAKFIETEAENFALFNLVNELNDEVENKRERISEVEEDMDTLSAESDKGDAARAASLVELETKLHSTENRMGKYGTMATEAEAELNVLVDGVKRMFDEVKADRSAIDGLLGEKAVTTNSVLQYLGLIEQRANELLRQQAQLEAKAAEKWDAEADRLTNASEDPLFDPSSTLGPKPKASSLLGTGPKPRLDAVHIEPPSTAADDEDSDDDGDALRPLTHAELRAKIMLQKSKPPSTSATKQLPTMNLDETKQTEHDEVI